MRNGPSAVGFFQESFRREGTRHRYHVVWQDRFQVPTAECAGLLPVMIPPILVTIIGRQRSPYR